MKKMTMSTGVLIGALSLVCAVEAQTPSGVQVKLLDVLRTPIKQQKLADCDFQSAVPVSFGTGTMVTDAGGAVTLNGVDRKGTAWTATYHTDPGPGCQLWQAYLGTNGEVDLIFVQFGFDSSGGWDTILSLLLFDDQGRPFPWQAMGKFTTNDSGVRELVQLGKEKKLVAIVPERKGDAQGNIHYSYRAYTFAGIRATELAGAYGDVNWPLSDYPAPQNRTDLTVVHTLTTSGQSDSGNEIPPNPSLFKGLIGTNDSQLQLVMSNTSFRLPDVLVVESTAGRKITSSPMNSDLISLQALHAAGIALGNNCQNRPCHPVVLWLKQ